MTIHFGTNHPLVRVPAGSEVTTHPLFAIAVAHQRALDAGTPVVLEMEATEADVQWDVISQSPQTTDRRGILKKALTVIETVYYGPYPSQPESPQLCQPNTENSSETVFLQLSKPTVKKRKSSSSKTTRTTKKA